MNNMCRSLCFQAGKSIFPLSLKKTEKYCNGNSRMSWWICHKFSSVYFLQHISWCFPKLLTIASTVRPHSHLDNQCFEEAPTFDQKYVSTHAYNCLCGTVSFVCLNQEETWTAWPLQVSCLLGKAFCCWSDVVLLVGWVFIALVLFLLYCT